MAKKRKSRSRNTAQNKAQATHASLARVNRPASAVQAKRNRYSGKYLTLAIMGGAAFFALKACSDDTNADNGGDGVFYSSVNDCIDGGNSASVCTHGWNNAKSEFFAHVPKQMSQESCEAQYVDCYFDSIDRSWTPMMSGFLLSLAVRKGRDEEYTYYNGGSSYSSRAVWRTSSGAYAWRSGKNDIATSHTLAAKKTATVSRGGYGRSSSARGHWGG
ncbi:TPA: DUF1190 domain-containing protein [Klebsiella pneumoniae]|nr:DUF1190 domain-containing protein [Klebsiella pneumoniae]